MTTYIILTKVKKTKCKNIPSTFCRKPYGILNQGSTVQVKIRSANTTLYVKKEKQL